VWEAIHSTLESARRLLKAERGGQDRRAAYLRESMQQAIREVAQELGLLDPDEIDPEPDPDYPEL